MIDQETIDGYRAMLLATTSAGPPVSARYLKPIVELRRLAPHLTYGGLAFLPWNGRPLYRVAGCGGPKIGENRTPRIPEPVIGTLLHCSLKYIDLFSADNWTLVILGFEAEFAACKDPHFDIERGIAHQTARHWRPQQYGSFTGQIITPSDNYVLRKIDSIEAAIGEIGVRTAFGDWADRVPAGKIGVYGQRIVGCDHPGFTQYDGPEFKGLCDAKGYEAGRPVNTFAALGVELLA